MDPNLFYLDGERVAEVLGGIVVLAFLLERALALLFETRWFINRMQGKNVKELIAFLTGFGVCWYWKFDALSIILPRDKASFIGIVLTGAVVAGGSKASIKLFKDVMGFMSEAEQERRNKRRDTMKSEKKVEGGKQT